MTENEKRVKWIKDLIDKMQRVIDNQNMEIEQLKETIRSLREEDGED